MDESYRILLGGKFIDAIHLREVSSEHLKTDSLKELMRTKFNVGPMGRMGVPIRGKLDVQTFTCIQSIMSRDYFSLLEELDEYVIADTLSYNKMRSFFRGNMLNQHVSDKLISQETDLEKKILLTNDVIDIRIDSPYPKNPSLMVETTDYLIMPNDSINGCYCTIRNSLALDKSKFKYLISKAIITGNLARADNSQGEELTKTITDFWEKNGLQLIDNHLFDTEENELTYFDGSIIYVLVMEFYNFNHLTKDIPLKLR